MVKSNKVAIGPAGSRAVGPALDVHTFPVYLYLMTWRKEARTLGIGTRNVHASRTGPCPNIP